MSKQPTLNEIDNAAQKIADNLLHDEIIEHYKRVMERMNDGGTIPPTKEDEERFGKILLVKSLVVSSFSLGVQWAQGGFPELDDWEGLKGLKEKENNNG